MIGDIEDPRWAKFDADWTCSGCADHHRGLFDLAIFAPGAWDGPQVYAPNSQLETGGDFLSEDFCVVDGEHFFVRCTFDLPLVGRPGRFGYGVWSTLSRDNFHIYVESFDDGMQGDIGPWFGWFSNRLPGYPDTYGLKVHVQPRDGRQRPSLSIIRESVDHPLAIEQREGVTYDRLCEIYATFGHGPAAVSAMPS